MPKNRTKLQTFRARALQVQLKRTITRQINFIRLLSITTLSYNRALFNTRQLIFRNLNNITRRLLINYKGLKVLHIDPAYRRLYTKFRHVLRIIVRFGLSNNIIRPGLMNIFPTFSRSLPFTRLALSNNVVNVPQLRVTIFTSLSRNFPTIRTQVNTNRNRAFGLTTTYIARKRNHSYLNTTFSRRLNNSIRYFTRLRTYQRRTILGIQNSIRRIRTTRLFKTNTFSSKN